MLLLMGAFPAKSGQRNGLFWFINKKGCKVEWFKNITPAFDIGKTGKQICHNPWF